MRPSNSRRRVAILQRKVTCEKKLEPISKMSFGLPPFSAGLVSRFKSSIRLRRTCGLKLGPAVRVPAKPRFSRGEEGILNQNPIFETGSNNYCQLMAENDTSWLQEDNSWRKPTRHGESKKRI
jgi:hypothetical protein